MRTLVVLLGFLAGLAPVSLPGQSRNHGAAVKASLDRSRLLFPEAARPDSALSMAILRRIEWLGENNPGYFSDPDWPVKLTAREALTLGIRAVPPPGHHTPTPAPRESAQTRYLAMVTKNFSVTGASFRKNQQIILESIQDYGKRGTTLVDGRPILLWLDRIKVLRKLPPGKPVPVVVKIISARYGPPGRAGYSVSQMVQSLISPDAEGRYEILVSDALLTPGAARSLRRSTRSQPAFDPNTGQPNVRGQSILTVTYTIQGVPKTKQGREGETLILD